MEKLVIKKKKYSGETQVVSARLAKDMIQDIDRVAAETGYNRNEVIALCMEFALKNLVTDDGKGARK